MSENHNISSLFDASGNLTLNAMERYLRDELSQDERTLVEKHLAESDFDREALEGLRKHTPEGFRQEVEDLQADILLLAEKRGKTGSTRISRKTYWYAAAGLAGLICLPVLMFFMFRSPVEKPQLAIAQQDTIVDKVTTAAGQSENSRIIEKENIPVTEEKREITSPVNPSPQRSAGIEKMTPEPNQPVTQLEVVDNNQPGIINDDIPIIVEADELTEFQIVGGVAITDDNKAMEKNLDRKGERVTMNYQVQAQSAVSESKYKAHEIESESQIFMVVEEMPQFPGGDTVLYQFLNENIRYPDSAKTAGIQGRVFITFVVNTDGSISDVRILRGIGGGCDEEALRVVKSMPNWIPGTQRGKPVRVQYNLPVKFSLE